VPLIALQLGGMRCGCRVCCIPVVIRDSSEKFYAVVEVAGHLTFLNLVDERFSIAEINFKLVHQAVKRACIGLLFLVLTGISVFSVRCGSQQGGAMLVWS
jgi:hypothetical protein